MLAHLSLPLSPRTFADLRCSSRLDPARNPPSSLHCGCRQAIIHCDSSSTTNRDAPTPCPQQQTVTVPSSITSKSPLLPTLLPDLAQAPVLMVGQTVELEASSLADQAPEDHRVDVTTPIWNGRERSLPGYSSWQPKRRHTLQREQLPLKTHRKCPDAIRRSTRHYRRRHQSRILRRSRGISKRSS